MRTHLLSEINLPGKVLAAHIPDFSFHHLKCIESLLLSSTHKDSHTAEIVFHYSGSTEADHLVSFRFNGIRRLQLPDFTPKGFVSEIEIEDASSAQMEGIRFHLRAYGTNDFEIFARDMELSACVPIDAC